jgi:hypothetical protein
VLSRIFFTLVAEVTFDFEDNIHPLVSGAVGKELFDGDQIAKLHTRGTRRWIRAARKGLREVRQRELLALAV